MSLFSALSVSASGMEAQRIRAQTLVENMANSETTRTPEGGPYRHKDVVFQSEPQVSAFSAAFQAELEPPSTGVSIADVVVDDRLPEMRFEPGHPDADKNGYVAYPRINPSDEMVDLMGASRGYQGNVAAMTAVKDMLHRSIDLLR